MNLLQIKASLRERNFEMAFQFIDESLAVQPENPYLWILRGDVIQLLDIPNGPPLSEVEKSYLKAVEINPHDLEAIESLAHYYDAVGADIDRSKKYAGLYLGIVQKSSAAMTSVIEGTSYLS